MRNENTSVRWAASPSVRATSTEDGSVLLDISKGQCYSLNAVAARIWATIESCPSGITVEAIVGALETDYNNVTLEELRLDTVECLERLSRLGLVQSNGNRIP